MKGVNGTERPTWQPLAAIIVAVALVASGGAIILRSREFGVGFFLWMASAIAIAIAVFIRIQSGGRPQDVSAAAAREFRILTLMAVLVGFSAVVNGVLGIQSDELGWALASIVQLAGAAAIGVYAVVRRNGATTDR